MMVSMQIQGKAGATNTSRRSVGIPDSKPGFHSRKDLAFILSSSGPRARINAPRECKRPVVYALLNDQQGEHHTPKTYGQAMKAEDAAQWRDAMREEISSSAAGDRPCHVVPAFQGEGEGITLLV